MKLFRNLAVTLAAAAAVFAVSGCNLDDLLDSGGNLTVNEPALYDNINAGESRTYNFRAVISDFHSVVISDLDGGTGSEYDVTGSNFSVFCPPASGGAQTCATTANLTSGIIYYFTVHNNSGGARHYIIAVGDPNFQGI